MQNCVAWLFEVGKRERGSTFWISQRSENFFLDSALRNRGWILRVRFCKLTFLG